MPKLRYVSLLAILVILSGCHLQSQSVRLAPSPVIPFADVGNGSSVSVRFVDGRESNIIGLRGAGQVKEGSGTITAADGVELQMLTTIQNALRQKGFKVTDSQDKGSANLTVELRGLRYGWQTALLGATLKAECALKASGSKPTGNFEQVYRVEKIADTNWVPTAEYNEKLINDTVSEALLKMMNDGALLVFLKG
jgi:uncharacterized lipoprotein